jgi:predicted membrane protein
MTEETKWDDKRERWERKRARWEQKMQRRRYHGVWAGVIIVIAGILLLLNRMNFPVPYWVFTWPMLVLAIGVIISLQSGFRNAGGLIMIIIGGAFLARDSFHLPFDFGRFIWPMGIILIGLLLIVRPKKRCYRHEWGDWHKGYWDWKGNFSTTVPAGETVADAPKSASDVQDRLDCTSVFSGQNRTVISKNFSGGEMIAVFGGIEADLTQADINKTVVIDVSAVFGGIKLFVPSNWEIRTNLAHVFAGIDDKRPLQGRVTDANKVLVITGTVIFGGIEIRSF